MKYKSLHKFKKIKTVPKVELIFSPSRLTKKPLDTTNSRAKFLSKIFDKKTFNLREESVVVIFGRDLIPIGYFSMSKGDKESVHTDIQYLMQMLILSGADGFIISHNHPLDTVTPSDDDFKFTISIKKVADFFGFTFIDHIILNDSNYFSFDDAGLIW